MESVAARLLGPAPQNLRGQRRIALLGILLVTLLGGVARFWRLGYPDRLVFDETYYVKQGWSLVTYGHEREIKDGLEEPDELFTNGTPDVIGREPDLVVHPPVGKWMIGLGELVTGPESSFGWRLSSATIGTLSILVLGICAWLMWRNALLAISAATLMAVSYTHLTLPTKRIV